MKLTRKKATGIGLSGCAAVTLLSGVFITILVLTVHKGTSLHNKGTLDKKTETSTRRAIREVDVNQLCSEGHHEPHAEFWGDVVKPGASPGTKDGLETATATKCCEACQSTRGCNIWVWCNDPSSCGTQCWLKRTGSADAVQSHGKGAGIPWTSGKLSKDFDMSLEKLPPVNSQINTVALTTPHGVIRIKLKPEWSQSSVDFVRRVASNAGLCTPQCEFYRAEPGFLLQGSLRSYIPPNNQTKPGPKIMERGEIGWAGGSAGPDWFIYLGSQPATHWNHDHTVWGIIADNESFQVIEKIVMLPAVAPRPGEMHMMVDREPFTITVAS